MKRFKLKYGQQKGKTRPYRAMFEDDLGEFVKYKDVAMLEDQKAELLKEATLTYLRLQKESLLNLDFAIKTDYMRASLRNKISDITGTPEQLVQDKIESIARDLRDKKIDYNEAIKKATS